MVHLCSPSSSFRHVLCSYWHLSNGGGKASWCIINLCSAWNSVYTAGSVSFLFTPPDFFQLCSCFVIFMTDVFLCFQSMIQSRKAGLAHTLATRSSLNDEELVSVHKCTLPFFFYLCEDFHRPNAYPRPLTYNNHHK